MPDAGHIPVLVDQVLELLAPQPGQTAVDCTIGQGGHAERIIPMLGPGGRYLGFDLDPANVEFATRRLQQLANEHQVDLTMTQGNFVAASHVLATLNIPGANLVLADLGFSSNQMHDPDRGLSFEADGPLDMRLDPNGPTTAADLVNRLPQRELADLLYQLADERLSRKIARKIAQRREHMPIQTTRELADLVRSAYGPRESSPHGRSRIDPATRTFMALRIAVNGELEALDGLLEALADIAAPGGRIGIISFHSLEDRRVKYAFRDLEAHGIATRISRKPVTADEAEVWANPRSRSAKLRVLLWRDRSLC